MNPFPKELSFENAGMVNGKQHIRTTADFLAKTSLGEVIVPAGTLSDGASFPQLAQSIMGDRFDYLKEGVTHDFLYSPANKVYSRSEADYILRELIYNVGWPIWKVNAFYLAVRMGGRRHFKAKPLL